MSETDPADVTDAEIARKPRGKGLIFGLIGALALGGGGFYATYAGLISLGGKGESAAASDVAPLPPLSFVPLDQMLVPVGRAGSNRLLRFTAELEVDPAHRADVETLRPRVLDVLNTYLRALRAGDLEDPAAMTRLRAQMLRRIQIVTGEGRVRDLLITEFVLN
ncbi:MAG: flagellar basal body-associated FliL family protein [Pseudomonadota bacterium]